MIDLTNRTIEELNGLIQKYALVVGLFRPPEQPYIAYIVDIAVNHIKATHNDLPLDWKCWSTIVVKNAFFNNKINKDSNIIEFIDDFITYWKQEYQRYCDNLGMSASEYDRDRGFVFEYTTKKIGSH